MSLATRCPHCNTIFKVVQDQLKVSEGWVRCGRCHDVFNALEGLFDMEREPPPQRVVAPPAPEPAWMPTQAEAEAAAPLPIAEPPAPEHPAPPAAVAPGVGTIRVEHGIVVADASPAVAPPFEPEVPEPESLPVTDEADALESRYLLSTEEHRLGRRRVDSTEPDFADARFPSDATVEAAEWGNPWPDAEAFEAATGTSLETSWTEGDEEPPSGSRLLSQVDGGTVGAASPAPVGQQYTPEQSLPPPSKRKGRPGTRGRSPSSADEPEFIRQAERKAVWRHPAVRSILILLLLVFSVLLAGQLVHHERNLIASRYPALAPWLAQWCSLVQCSVQAPMHLDDLQVENIELVRTASQGADTYRLTTTIGNRAPMAVAWPHLDLTLTDVNGQVLVRRAFAVSSATVAPTTVPGMPSAAPAAVPREVPANSTTTLQWELRAPDLQLAGYTVELFYP